MSVWIAIGIVWLVASILAALFVCNGINWNDDERQAEAEGVGHVGGAKHQHNGIARPWLRDSVPAENDDSHRTSLGTDGGDPR